jgi:predicted permease
MTDRWIRVLLRLYPPDFRGEMGSAMRAAYRDRAADARRRGGRLGAIAFWISAFADAIWNGAAERLHPAAIGRRAGGWGRDLTIARRRLAREPLFVIVTVATLSVGLGAFAVAYTAVEKILLEPLPYRAPANLYWVWRDQSADGGVPREFVSGPDVAELHHAGTAIDAVAGIQIATPTLAPSKDGEPMQIVLMPTTTNLFDLLGVSPALGRVFTSADSGPDLQPVVILSHPLWTRLGADPALVGRQVWMSGSPYEVIGVLPETFHFGRHGTVGPPVEADVYVPLRTDPARQSPNATSFAALIRVKDGTSAERALSAVEAAGRSVNERHTQARPFRLWSVGVHEDLVARVRPVLIALALAAGFLLLVLGVNLASLLLSRAAAREREVAVSRAVGANQSAITRAIVAEGLFLGVAGGLAGAVAGHWGTRLLVSLAPDDLPRLHALALDWQVGVVVVVVGGVLGIAASLLPAAWASSVSLSSLLASVAMRGAAGVTPMRRVLIATQIAASLVLLSAGALVVRSFERLLSAAPGFRSEGILTFTVAMGPRLFPKPEQVMLFEDRLEAALREIPGVLDASATTALPLQGREQSTAAISLPAAPGNRGDPAHDNPTVDAVMARASYPHLMGMTLVAGRGFEPVRRPGVHEALIDVRMAGQFFPAASPLGSTVIFNGVTKQPLTVVGVVTPARLYDLHDDGRPQIYMRAEDWTPYTPSFVIRTAGDPGALAAAVARTVRQVDARIPVSNVRTMDEIVEATLRQPRISAVLIAGLAVGALLLVAMGVFGLVAGAVSQRRSELAVRLALGATPYGVLRLVLGEGALLVGAGMLLAVPGVYLAGRFVRGLLVGVTPLDPLSLLAAAAGLAMVTLVACYVPARRVLGIDPSPLLRQ